MKAITIPADVVAKRSVESRTVLATVFAVVHEFKHARAESKDGRQYAITEKTPGIEWESLRVGQHVECTLTTTALPRVIEAHTHE